MNTHEKSAGVTIILLIALLALAGASGANAVDIGPGLVTGPVEVTLSNSPANVVGFTAITSTGNGINAPSNAGPGVTLNINTESAAQKGVISITSSGAGVVSNFPTGPATINITSGPSGPVRILSGGPALAIAGDSSLTANANGGNLVFHSTAAAFGVSAQFGATIDMTGPATIISDGGVGAVLIGGSLTDLGAKANLANVNILANGALIGLDATRMGTVATMTGGSITVIGDGIAGLYSDTNGVTNATNVKITTTGANTYGAFAEATIPGTPLVSPGGGTIGITGGSITTGGTGAFGVFAQGQLSVPSTITLNNSAITTTGDGAVGYRADGGAISATNTTTQTSGASAPGGMLSNGGTVTINGGSVTTTGPGSFGFLVQPATVPLLTPSSPGPNMLQISNATVNAAADAFHVTGAVADITVNASSITSGNGVLLNSIGSTGTFNIENSTLGGTVMADSESTVDVNLLGNSTLTGVIDGAHNLLIDPSTWVMPNDSSITGNLTLQGNLIINSAAKFAVTGQASVLTIGGNFTMRRGSTLSLGIGGLLPKQYDRVQVGGNAILSGNLVVSSLNGFHPSAGNAFLVLRANGIRLGNFSQLNDSAFNNNPSISAQLRPVEVELVAPNGIVLVYLKPTSPSPSPPIIDVLPEPLPPVNPDEPISKEEVVQLVVPNVEQLTALYEIGFSVANMQRFNLGDRMFQIQQGMTGFVSPITPAPLPAPTGKEITEGKGVEGKAPPPAPLLGPTNRWGIWANGWGDFVHLDSTSAAQGYNFTTGGMSAGVDYLITDHFAVGLFGGYSHTWVNFNSSGGADVNTGRGGLYATYFQQGWWINAAVWGGGNSYSTSRQALAGQANGETDGWELSTFGDAGYDFHYGDLSFGPTVSMQYTDVHISGFGEHGSMVPLNIHGDSQDSLRTDVGGQAYYRWHVGNIPVIPNVRLAWEHEYFYSALPITATAPALDGATATFSGPNEGHDSLVINANIAVQWTPRIWTTIGYDGQCARDHYNSNAVTGTFSFSF